MVTWKSTIVSKWLNAFVLIAIVVIAIETMSFVAGKFLVRQAILYDPLPVENYSDYLKNRDPVLGWPSRTQIGKGEYDRSGSRIVPEFPDPSIPNCIAIFGDSFTWGDEVTPEQSYGNVLSRLMGCRVANYGVGGYGTDQAYLRYLSVIKDNAPIVILGHFSDNIIRNVNQERGFITNNAIGLKPRFIIENGELKLIPLPTLTEAEHLSLRIDAGKLLPYEYFVPGGPSGLHSFQFPYTISVLSALQHYRLKARIQGYPSYAEFYNPQHPSHALQVTDAIIKAFVREANERHQKPMVLLIPDAKDISWLREHGTLPYAELEGRLKKAGIIVPDVAKKLNESLEGGDICELYSHCTDGHFTPIGYRRLAEIVFAKLVEIGWVTVHLSK